MAKAYVSEGAKLLESGQPEQAAEKFQQALRLNPDDLLTQYDYGLALLLQNKLDEAIAQLHAVLASRPDDPDANYYLGRAMLAKDLPTEAVTFLRETVQARPEDSHAHNALGVALARINKFAEASDEIQTAHRLEPHNQLFSDNLNCVKKQFQGCAPAP